MTLALRQVHVGDCRDLLAKMPDESVNCVVTSVPYWGLRDYGTATWEGGSASCSHVGRKKPRQDTHGAGINKGRFSHTRGTQASKRAYVTPVRSVCKCGARRVDKQIGLEETPEEWVAALVQVFREVWRVLRPDGTVWINVGDSYSLAPGGGGTGDWLARKKVSREHARRVMDKRVAGLKPKDLVGAPWMLAFALRADGWWLRAENIWHKINPLPESAVDRPSRDHEQVFLFTKSERYFYDREAVKQRASGGAHTRGFGLNPKTIAATEMAAMVPKDTAREQLGLKTGKRMGRGRGWRIRANESFSGAINEVLEWRNLRTVWPMVGYQYDGAHFATFPPALAQNCILAGCPAGGVVLDPFGGSGTVGEVAEALGRNWILFDLNPDYAELARQRTAQRGLCVEVVR